MTKLYCIEGRVSATAYGTGPLSTETHWPVCYRLDEVDALMVKQTCEAQRDAFVKELTPIWEQLGEDRPLPPRIRASPRERRHAEGQHKLALDEWHRNQRRLRDQEAEITARWAGDMLDPLFPTSTNGTPPDEVVYAIVVFWDDPREMGVAELMKLRAQLHGQTKDDEGGWDVDDD